MGLDDPNVVALGLPALFAIVVLIIVSLALRKESFAVRTVISTICGIATYVLLVVLLISAGVQPR